MFGFPSYLFRAGSFDIREAANRLHLELKTQAVLDDPAIVFVAHSMGGLVVMRELLTNRDILPKVPVVVFYATPMEGPLMAAIGKESHRIPPRPNDPGRRQRPVQSLSDDWQSIPDGVCPHVRCAYEKTPVSPAMIVPWVSATRFCEGARPAIEASHITIVKPDRPGADAILVLVERVERLCTEQVARREARIAGLHTGRRCGCFRAAPRARQAERSPREQREAAR